MSGCLTGSYFQWWSILHPVIFNLGVNGWLSERCKCFSFGSIICDLLWGSISQRQSKGLHTFSLVTFGKTQNVQKVLQCQRLRYICHPHIYSFVNKSHKQKHKHNKSLLFSYCQRQCVMGTSLCATCILLLLRWKYFDSINLILEEQISFLAQRTVMCALWCMQPCR